ncbi:MAG: hypothetical protein ACLQGP_21460, partial [Isosphaeraceae bacterium]
MMEAEDRFRDLDEPRGCTGPGLLPASGEPERGRPNRVRSIGEDRIDPIAIAPGVFESLQDHG